MVTREMTVKVQGGRVTAERDDGGTSSSDPVGSDPIDEAVIRVFERWLIDPERTWPQRDVAAFGIPATAQRLV